MQQESFSFCEAARYFDTSRHITVRPQCACWHIDTCHSAFNTPWPRKVTRTSPRVVRRVVWTPDRLSAQLHLAAAASRRSCWVACLPSQGQVAKSCRSEWWVGATWRSPPWRWNPWTTWRRFRSPGLTAEVMSRLRRITWRTRRWSWRKCVLSPLKGNGDSWMVLRPLQLTERCLINKQSGGLSRTHCASSAQPSGRPHKK